MSIESKPVGVIEYFEGQACVVGIDPEFSRLPEGTKLYAAQAIIDGLRGEVDVMTQHADNYSRMFEECAEQRDQLAGLLREVHDTYRAAIHWEDLRSTMKRIDAALSAHKDA